MDEQQMNFYPGTRKLVAKKLRVTMPAVTYGLRKRIPKYVTTAIKIDRKLREQRQRLVDQLNSRTQQH